MTLIACVFCSSIRSTPRDVSQSSHVMFTCSFMREAKRDKGMYHSSLSVRSVCLGAARVEYNVDLLSSLSLLFLSFFHPDFHFLSSGTAENRRVTEETYRSVE
jgi:hypothetical protein